MPLDFFIDEGFKKILKNINDFVQSFKSGAWGNKLTKIKVYMKKVLFCEYSHRGDLKDDPALKYIKEIVKIVEATTVINSWSKPYDPSIFKS